jgi:hypothetical protein
MKINQITFIVMLLGLSSSLLAQYDSNNVYKLTENTEDSITAKQDPLNFSIGVGRGNSIFGMLKEFTEDQLSYLTDADGSAVGRSGLFAIVGGEWTFDQYGVETYVSGTAKLEPVEDMGAYVGAPSVEQVNAIQIAGTKTVGINFWLQFDKAAHSDVYIEVWFRESASDVQWHRCLEISAPDYGVAGALDEVMGYGDSGTYEPVTHKTTSSSTWLEIVWDAETEKTNFKGDDCQIRVMAIYRNPDIFDEENQGSGWDGYDVELGDKFVRTSDPQVDVRNPSAPLDDKHSANLFFLNYIGQENITRKGTAIIDGNNYPVFHLTSTDFEALTGTAGQAGDYAYAFQQVFDSAGYPIDLECIIGRVVPQ